MGRLTDKDWKNPQSTMWVKVDLHIKNPYYNVAVSRGLQKLAEYEDLEEQGRMIELPCKKVFRIINGDSPKYAFVDSIPIEMMPVYEIKQIDNGNVFFSTKEKAEVKLKELEDGNN